MEDDFVDVDNYIRDHSVCRSTTQATRRASVNGDVEDIDMTAYSYGHTAHRSNVQQAAGAAHDPSFGAPFPTSSNTRPRAAEGPRTDGSEGVRAFSRNNNDGRNAKRPATTHATAGRIKRSAPLMRPEPRNVTTSASPTSVFRLSKTTPPPSTPQTPMPRVSQYRGLTTPQSSSKRSRDENPVEAHRVHETPSKRRLPREGNMITPPASQRSASVFASHSSTTTAPHRGSHQQQTPPASGDSTASMENLADHVKKLFSSQQPVLDLLRDLANKVNTLEARINDLQHGHARLRTIVEKADDDNRSRDRHVDETFSSFARQWSQAIEKVQDKSQQ